MCLFGEEEDSRKCAYNEWETPSKIGLKIETFIPCFQIQRGNEFN